MDTQTAPVIAIAATDRPLEWVDLVGIRYPVRRPKSIVEGGPKSALMLLAAFMDQDSEEGLSRAERRAKSGAKVKRIELTEDQFREGVEAVWRYLDVALADHADYVDIRRRVFGEDLTDEQAESHESLSFDVDPSPHDPIDIDNVYSLVIALIKHWSPEKETVKSAVKAPPKPAAGGGATTKRPARRPVKRG